jgi:hypothetical protein
MRAQLRPFSGDPYRVFEIFLFINKNKKIFTFDNFK